MHLWLSWLAEMTWTDHLVSWEAAAAASGHWSLAGQSAVSGAGQSVSLSVSAPLSYDNLLIRRSLDTAWPVSRPSRLHVAFRPTI